MHARGERKGTPRGRPGWRVGSLQEVELTVRRGIEVERRAHASVVRARSNIVITRHDCCRDVDDVVVLE